MTAPSATTVAGFANKLAGVVGNTTSPIVVCVVVAASLFAFDGSFFLLIFCLSVTIHIAVGVDATFNALCTFSKPSFPVPACLCNISSTDLCKQSSSLCTPLPIVPIFVAGSFDGI